MARSPLVLVYVNHTLQASAPSGVQRVVRSIAGHLPAFADVEFVTWDYAEGGLRYLDERGLTRLFCGENRPRGLRANPQAHRVNCRFGDTLPKRDDIWLLFPEIPYHSQSGTEVMRRILAMCTQYGVRTAAVYYDAIPITNASYRSLKQLHGAYLARLARFDRIYAISHHSKRQLAALYRRYLPIGPTREELDRRMTAIPLAESEFLRPRTAGNPLGQDKILVLGSVEPRKGQIRVLRAFRDVRAPGAGMEMHVIGSLHPDVADEFHALVGSLAGVHYHGYLPSAAIDQLFAQARFSIFASDDEGFGLPIAESLARGVPCLTADFGAMAEVAGGGGCLTVDVRSQSVLSRAIACLMQDDALIDNLRKEIAARSFRTWVDYATDLVADMTCVLDAERTAQGSLCASVRSALASCLEGVGPDGNVFPISLPGEDHAVRLVVETGCGGPVYSRPDRAAREFRVFVDACSCAGDETEHADAALCASALVVESRARLEELLACADRAGCGHMLPATCVTEEVDGTLAEQASRSVAEQLWASRGRTHVARREDVVRHLGKAWPEACDKSLPALAIVISTYNRAAFVERNVRWLLGLMRRFREDIRIIVVDNASSDDTLKRLATLGDHANLTVVSNAVNVGMLGNLRVCSTQIVARYVWLIGDDDFILPSGLAEVVDAIREHPEVPFVFTNFGVYFRSFLAPADTVESIVAERMPLAARPCPSGLYPVVRIAEQHDNLFTAIYPIVFRSDLLAACFDHPFLGKPFGNLVESVPTTRMLLGTYAETTAYWSARMAIIGNVSNSWSRHRPRWHAVIMPRVLQLAREVGVDAARLHAWSAVHLNLFYEARRQVLAEGVSVDIAEHELEIGRRVFRRKITLE
jgi:glycosyltransferase involved in cell wall biosynthesis